MMLVLVVLLCWCWCCVGLAACWCWHPYSKLEFWTMENDRGRRTRACDGGVCTRGPLEEAGTGQ